MVFCVRELQGPAEAGLNRVSWNLIAEKEQAIEPPEAAADRQTPFVPAGDTRSPSQSARRKSTAKIHGELTRPGRAR